MNRNSARGSKTDGAGLSNASEKDAGRLQRGDGMLPIVGLGGSAGGIAALQEFFATMPVDSWLIPFGN